MVDKGAFRQDSFHGVFVFPVTLRRLRERHEDIPALIEHFAKQVAEQNGWKKAEFDSEAVRALQAHAWPGNVRELRNVVERLLWLSADDKVTAETVPSALPQAVHDETSALSGTS